MMSPGTLKINGNYPYVEGGESPIAVPNNYPQRSSNKKPAETHFCMIGLAPGLSVA
jgi:hypothetical protein